MEVAKLMDKEQEFRAVRDAHVDFDWGAQPPSRPRLLEKGRCGG